VLEQSLAEGKSEQKSVLVDSWRGGRRRDGDGDELALLLIVMGLLKVAPG
jgi:hypothetical protein